MKLLDLANQFQHLLTFAIADDRGIECRRCCDRGLPDRRRPGGTATPQPETRSPPACRYPPGNARRCGCGIRSGSIEDVAVQRRSDIDEKDGRGSVELLATLRRRSRWAAAPAAGGWVPRPGADASGFLRRLLLHIEQVRGFGQGRSATASRQSRWRALDAARDGADERTPRRLAAATAGRRQSGRERLYAEEDLDGQPGAREKGSWARKRHPSRLRSTRRACCGGL